MYYTPKQVSELYGVARLTVYRWIKSKQLNCIKVGNSYKITEDDLKKFIKTTKEVI